MVICELGRNKDEGAKVLCLCYFIIYIYIEHIPFPVLDISATFVTMCNIIFGYMHTLYLV